MPPETKKAALADMLKNLSESNFKKFLNKLLDRREEPHVPRSQVDGKHFLDITNVLVSTFTEDGAVKVAVELLKDMNCEDEAKELVKVTAGLDSKAGTSDNQHFVDKHQSELIDRVSYVDPILDHLLEKGVLQQESYDTIRALPTSRMKMRELFSSGLKDDSASKDVLYEILQRREKFLIDDLNRLEKMWTQWLLFPTLGRLSSGELEDFCLHVELEKGVPLRSDLHLKPTDPEEIVKLMVKRFSEESVKLTKNILKKMRRTDLVQRFFDSRQESKEDEEQLSLTQRVEMMTSVIDLLVEITSCLTEDEHNHLKELIRSEYYKAYHSFYPRFLLETNHQVAACVIILTFGQNSVVKMMKFLKKMKRTDLVQKLLETSSSFKKKPSDEPRSVLFEKAATMAAVEDLLLEILQSLNNGELKKFMKSLLLAFKNDSIDVLHYLRRSEIVVLMMQTYGRQSVDKTREILKKLNRDDLMLMFPESSESKEKDSVDEHQPPKFETEMFNVKGCGRCHVVLNQTVKEDLEHILLETLRGLNVKEFKIFKWLLQLTYFQRSLRQIQRSEMKLASTPEKLVHLMVMNREPVEVTKEVLLDMNRTDLVERLLGTDSGFQGPFGSAEHEDCGQNMDSGHWTKLDPEVKSADGDESLTYSLQSEAGRFECSVSSIRWLCKDKVSFQYKFCSWEEPIERMESLNYLPAGPLMNIKVIAGKLDAVYLPHWICIDSNTDLSGEFAVLHIDDCGNVVEQVSEVTSSHVELAEPVFSRKGVVIKKGVPVKTNCSVLIYETNKTFLTLHVYLIPHDPGSQEVIDRRELCYKSKVIQKPPPGESLQMQDCFFLSTDVDGAEIEPEKVKLEYEWSNQQYFEVWIGNPDREFTLMLTKKKGKTPFWSRKIRKDDSQSIVLTQEVHFVDKHQCDLKENVSNIGPILDKLLKEGVILQEVYDQIRATPTSQEKMRKLFSGPLKAGGQAAKDVFYKILEKEEPYLVADLKRKESGAAASWS